LQRFGRKKTEAMDRVPTVAGTTNLVDILDRVLDKGLVIAGDVRIALANVELLTIRIRLLVCSVDKAEEIGLNWWKYDPHLTMQSPLLPGIDEAKSAASRRRAGVPGRDAGVPGRKAGVPGRTRRKR
jgi:Gas vesicle protein